MSENVLVLSDDLTGAQEALAALVHTSAPLRLSYRNDSAKTALAIPSSFSKFTAIDLDYRYSSKDYAALQVSQAVSYANRSFNNAEYVVYLKLDSILRGNVVPMVKELSKDRPVVFAPAAPVINRTVKEGVVYVEGTPLHETALWQIEDMVPPSSIQALLELSNIAVVGIDEVRSGKLASVVAEKSQKSRIVIIDSETNEDLKYIAQAAQSLNFHLAGSAGLAGIMGKSESTVEEIKEKDNTPAGKRNILLAIGSASRQAKEQVAQLETTGVRVKRWSREDNYVPHEGDCAVYVDEALSPAESMLIERQFTQSIVKNLGDRDLFITGGSTARSVLEQLGEETLELIGQIEPGAILSVANSGRLVATRPGSFGTSESLINIFNTLLKAREGE